VKSLCVATSRLPLLDLEHHVMSRRVEVGGLTFSEGRDLFLRLGVHPDPELLDRIIVACGGHAMTLALLGRFCVQRFAGDASKLVALPEFADWGSEVDSVRQILEWYDSVLLPEERTLLIALSLLRVPLPRESLVSYARAITPKQDGDTVKEGVGMAPTEGNQSLDRLREYRLVNLSSTGELSLHPLIRGFYYERLLASGIAESWHLGVASWYLKESQHRPRGNGLAALSSPIEAVYHLCRSGDYASAFKLYRAEVDRGEGHLQYRLGAYDTDLRLLEEFFS
jgi:hypothetical protein